MDGTQVHPSWSDNKEQYIYERHPDWDGNIDGLVDFLNTREGNFYELWYRDDVKQWVWLDYYFNIGTSHADKHAAILDGAAASCYWATDYEKYELATND